MRSAKPATILATAMAIAALGAAPALASPVFEVGLESDAPSAEFPIVHHSDERVDYTVKVKNVGSSETSGQVSLEVHLPGGRETFAYKAEGSGWSCVSLPADGAQSARAACTSTAEVPAGAEYPQVKVIAALGADAPDVAFARASASGAGAGVATATRSFLVFPAVPFGLTKFTSAMQDEELDDYTLAGGHPFRAFAETALSVKRALVPEIPSVPYLPVDHLKQIVAELPPGIVGNALALPARCPGVAELAEHECPQASAIGGILVQLSAVLSGATVPIYAIEPEFGLPAQFAFQAPDTNIYTFSPHLRAAEGYAIDFEIAPTPEVNFLEGVVTFCSLGAKVAGTSFTGCKKASEIDANPKPLFTTPTSCEGPLRTGARLNSWEDPDTIVHATPFLSSAMEHCEELPFEPEASFKPTSGEADSPTGMQVSLSMPTDGLEESAARAQSNLKEATIVFPEGMAINPSAAQGLGACSADQVKLGTNDPIQCPESSKVGTVELQTPLIADPLKGSVYVARQGEVEGSLLGLYLVFDSPRNGILIKQASAVTPDPGTGRLTATVKGIPQQPFSEVKMDFPQSDRATLLNPPSCGRYEITARLVPWSGGAAVTRTTPFEIGAGPGGGGCPSGGLDPQLTAGSEDPTAGATSPFVLRLHHEDGSDRFSSLKLRMPPGLTAYLKDVPYCPDPTLASISSALGTGRDQIEHPSCPAASQIGTVTAGAGAGPDPFYTDTGRAYLAGPYKGAPLSIAVVAPAVAGPLDLGTVVVRNALHLDPNTAEVSAVSDPIPTIWHGLLLDIRDIRVAIDRPRFTLNPTSCAEKSLSAEVGAPGGASATVSRLFQARGCGSLSFEPKLYLRLFGGTRRGANPKLRGVYIPGKGNEANLRDLAVTIPRSEFLDQSHIRTVCTRVQFAAKACPKGSVYGHVKAFSPIVDYPLTGPVYLRSSSNQLPDMVVDLHGPDYQPVEVTAVARIDSIKGQIRASFEEVPDAPVSKILFFQQGGKKGLLINSRNICAHTNRATVRAVGQNAKTHGFRPVVNNRRCKGKARRSHSRHMRARVAGAPDLPRSGCSIRHGPPGSCRLIGQTTPAAR